MHAGTASAFRRAAALREWGLEQKDQRANARPSASENPACDQRQLDRDDGDANAHDRKHVAVEVRQLAGLATLAVLRLPDPNTRPRRICRESDGQLGEHDLAEANWRRWHRGRSVDAVPLGTRPKLIGPTSS